MLAGIADLDITSTVGTVEEFFSRTAAALLRTLPQRAARCVCDLIYQWAVENDDKTIVLSFDFQSQIRALHPLPGAGLGLLKRAGMRWSAESETCGGSEFELIQK